MPAEEDSRFRSTTPESPGLTSSLYHATSTIDDLTLALTNFSRVPSPEPSPSLTCCCGREDCENTRNWLSFKGKLESRLILSAEVGQALLQRHEAYVRQHERPRKSRRSSKTDNPDTEQPTTEDTIDSRVAQLTAENAVLEKRLNQALLNNEVADSNSKQVHQELEEAREAVSRLTAHHARSVGWDTRLMAALQEKEDMQQERDSESQRARLAESRIVALRERANKLQAEVRRLQEDLEQRRLHRLETSESIIQDARARIEKLQDATQRGRAFVTEDPEVTKVLEDLVSDNETLKRDNAELQSLLSSSRDDVRALQEEVEEQRASLPYQMPETPRHRQFFTGSTLLKESPSHRRRPSSVEPRFRRAAPLTPETDRRPLSPESFSPSDATFVSFGQPQYRYPHTDFDIEDDAQEASTGEKPKSHKTLYLLTRSTGVQTDGWLYSSSSPMPSTFGAHMSSPSPHDALSETSSLVDGHSSHMSIIVERVVALLNRITQADALTLTNRLKRQHLKGADVGHLSRNTITSICTEAASLRTQFRSLLEDDKASITTTRKDLRGLFKLFRDLFMELGQLRVTLNDVILDPTIAPKVRDHAMNPSKAEAAQREKESRGANAGGWMAPISKLFGAPSTNSDSGQASNAAATLQRSNSGRGNARPPARVVPKLGPAVSASAATVNVEFSGMGVTSTFSAHPDREGGNRAFRDPATSPPLQNTPSRSVMGIFAGAPKPVDPSDPWVVIASRQPQSAGRDEQNYSGMTIGRSAMRHANKSQRMSRQVDAVIDVDSPIQGDGSDFAPALERGLRRRGLSDSSIHSTFMSDEQRPANAAMNDGPTPRGTLPDRGYPSMFQALSKRVQSFRFTGVGSSQDPIGSPENVSPSPSRPNDRGDNLLGDSDPLPRITSPNYAGFIPSLASWASSTVEASIDGEHVFVGTPRDGSILNRSLARHDLSREI
ncbi:hypothetical protein PLICRDRAFT_47624 [Plicaturopsis crispa FD-325 SS-3]|nr:hypothetical protein PLICRDRAFT_47624 [Plicaturopsis crispa FD-325 SS-3]